MTYEWSNFLLYARALAELDATAPDDQTKFRNAVSRAYYAAHHIAYKRRLDFGHDPLPKIKRHTGLVEYFQEYDDQHGTEIGDVLNEIRIKRGEADYDDGISFTNRQVEDVIGTADAIIENVRRIRP